jgi:hypothetical protein
MRHHPEKEFHRIALCPFPVAISRLLSALLDHKVNLDLKDEGQRRDRVRRVAKTQQIGARDTIGLKYLTAQALKPYSGVICGLCLRSRWCNGAGGPRQSYA